MANDSYKCNGRVKINESHLSGKDSDPNNFSLISEWQEWPTMDTEEITAGRDAKGKVSNMSVSLVQEKQKYRGM